MEEAKRQFEILTKAYSNVNVVLHEKVWKYWYRGDYRKIENMYLEYIHNKERE